MSFNDGVLKGLGAEVLLSTAGEAQVIDFGDNGKLFVLLTNDYNRRESDAPVAQIFALLHKKVWDAVGVTAATEERLLAIKELTEVPLRMLPMLVHFKDINDPLTVEIVPPDELSSHFGPGFRLLRATVEITTEPITTGISSALPSWFEIIKMRRSSLDGDAGTLRSPNPPLANRLSSADFTQGL
ncbi:hypothetical protein GGD83_004276 [Rhodoblastus sphagnicola]|uniref:hypothetical protein n=1 Tax=Rhodoblastus sphagnicola TaxID=333368 RepID=UPI001613E57A|nr:hypothetical protein [Rhodoblastus sphagnicola]MBB4200447.1 hypothetical protein [Rhodoblastus sphagnicola]